MLLSSPLNQRIAINLDTCITMQAFLPLFSLTQHSKLQKGFCAESQLAAWFRDSPTSIEVGELASTCLKAPTADCIPTSYCWQLHIYDLQACNVQHDKMNRFQNHIMTMTNAQVPKLP